MAWVVDTCLLIDVAESDPAFGLPSARLIDSMRPQGLLLCPVTYVELAPLFGGVRDALDEFLFHLGVAPSAQWIADDTVAAYDAWYRYVIAKRAGKIPKRPVADMLIGAFATKFDGLLTRNEADFRPIFPSLRIVTP
jgi:predicted nucleic acid-binding protein